MLRKDFKTEFILNQAIVIHHFKGLSEALNHCKTNKIDPNLVARVLLNRASRRDSDWK